MQVQEAKVSAGTGTGRKDDTENEGEGRCMGRDDRTGEGVEVSCVPGLVACLGWQGRSRGRRVGGRGWEVCVSVTMFVRYKYGEWEY